MKKSILLSSALALGVAAGALSLPHLAAAADEKLPGPPHEWSERGHGHWQDGKFEHRRGRAMSFEHIDGGLAYLKAEIKITPDQEKLWTPFEAAVREQAGIAKKNMEARKAAMEARKDDKERPAQTVPERMAKAEERLTARLAAVKAISEPASKLYASLSVEQKKTADELLPSPMLPFPL